MGTTTKMAIPYPEATGLVKDGWEDMKDIATQVDAKSGLVLLSTTSFSAVSSFSLPANTFSSSYNDYLLLVNFTGASANMGLSLRLRAASSDFSSAAYDRGGLVNVMNSATLTALNAVSQTSWGLGEINTTYPTYSQFQIVFKSPQTTNAFKSVFTNATYVNSSGNGVAWFAQGAVSTASQYDSASVIASTGNFTGNYSVYGYNKA